MWQRVYRFIQHIEGMKGRSSWRLGGTALGLAVGAALFALPAPEALGVLGQRTLAVAVVMALWWVGQVWPMAVTGLVPIVAFPLLGVLTPKQAVTPYAHPLLFLMLGGFLMAAGMRKAEVHTRLVAWLLRPQAVRVSPARMCLALMVATALLSSLVSNTATVVMLLPLSGALASRAVSDPRSRTAFPLAMAYAASIGGTATLVGTPPNAVFAGLASDQGVDVGFAKWLMIGAPFVVLALPVAWWVVTRWVFRLPQRSEQVPDAPATPDWTSEERWVVIVVAVALLAWLSRAPLTLGPLEWQGWGARIGWKGSECDAMVAIVAGCSMFAVPKADEDGTVRPLLDWASAERAVPWSVILLLGGGFALAEGIKASGLTEWIAGGAVHLAGLPLPVTVLGICLAMTFVTELTSNTASTQIALPLLAAAAVPAGVDPIAWMVPATLSASCAFMMPVATAPNAIATEAGSVSPADMALAGVVLNPVLAIVCTGLCAVWVPWVLG